MPDPSSRSNLRLLAPAALGVVALIFVILVITSVSGGSDDSVPAPASDTTPTTKSTAKKKVVKKQPATYTVKTGDNLGAIAQKTNVPVEKLQELNPDLDPQAMVTGQKIKLK